jgi:proline dehydrogenase
MKFLTNLIVDLLAKMPEGFIWKFAKRYIAGPQMEDGLRVREELFRKGILATMDVVGEDTLSEEDAEAAALQYEKLIDGIAGTNIPGNVSLKLSQMGLKVNFESAKHRVERLAMRAAEKGFFFRIDMEDSSVTDQTLDVYRYLREKIPSIGTVLQSYLKRSVEDIKNLQAEGPTNIRICKGIYVESPSIAFKEKQLIRDNYMAMLRQLFDGGSYAAIATHDKWLIDEALKEIKKRKLPPDRYEFQMLHGVGEQYREDLLKSGHRIRIYIPFGVAWKAYSFRRFRENPSIAYYVIKNMFPAP